MNYFLSGGAKNGKSSLAQDIVCAQPGPHYYLATMIPHDDEDLLRIRRHLDNRAGMGFETVECGTDIPRHALLRVCERLYLRRRRPL